MTKTLPRADHFELLHGGNYAAWKGQTESSNKELTGYLSTGTANGYGGNIIVVIATSSEGVVLNLEIVEHKETFSFLRRVLKSDFPNSLIGKSYSDPFVLKQDVDGVSGATFTSRALAEAVRKASRKIAGDVLGFTVPPEPTTEIQFGFPEAVLIALFIMGYVTTRRWIKHKKIARWTLMLVGLVFLGFMFNQPITLVFINKVILGFWSGWQTHLYWYLLMFGILLFVILENRNLYCDRICPFGAAQECIGAIGGAKNRMPERYREVTRWIHRVIALTAVLIALVLSNPGISSYEIFGAFFHLVGSSILFVLLGIVLITALFIKRPWCNYLCPIRPVFDFIRLFRNWFKELWSKPEEN